MPLKVDVKKEFTNFLASDKASTIENTRFRDLELAFNAGYQAALNKIINETDLKYRILSGQVNE